MKAYNYKLVPIMKHNNLNKSNYHLDRKVENLNSEIIQLKVRFDYMQVDLKEVKSCTKLIENRLIAFENKVDTKFSNIDGKFNSIDVKFDIIDAKFDKIDAKFDKIDAKFDKMDAKFDKLFYLIISMSTTTLISVLLPNVWHHLV